jgi:hypothetical protein
MYGFQGISPPESSNETAYHVYRPASDSPCFGIAPMEKLYPSFSGKTLGCRGLPAHSPNDDQWFLASCYGEGLFPTEISA